jgi:hypothetical protein
MPSWFRSPVSAIAAVALAAAILAVSASRSTPPDALKIAAMPPGTSWYVFAATLTQMIEPLMPPGASVEVFARGGGIGNPSLVENGKVQIALSQVATAVWARNGDALAYNGVKHGRIRALVGGLNSVWITALATEEYVHRTGHATLEQALAATPGPRIVMKPPGAAPPMLFDRILRALGSSRGRIRANGGAIIQVAVSQIPDMLADGRADIYVEGAVKGHPTLTEVSTLTPVRFLDFSPALQETLAGTGLRPGSFPAWFKGQQGPTRSADCGTVLIAREDLPHETAYLVTRTLCERRDEMVRAHKAWADFQPSQAGKPENTGIPLHPGAERYYRDRGWM